MKKTLFTVAALALCGTAVAGTYTTSTSQLEAESNLNFNSSVYGIGNDITLNVDKTVTFSSFDGDDSGFTTTFNFVGAGTAINVTDYFSFFGHELTVNGDTLAQQSWAEALLSSAGEVNSVTLMNSANETWLGFNSANFVPVTLGGTSVQYMSYTFANTLDEAKTIITGDNQVALAFIQGGGKPGQIVLLGKITGSPATPEPATATLSLMALAGLATRRRRK